jgi:hypothetical protein
VEGVGPSIRGDVPSLRQTRHGRGIRRVVTGQPFEQGQSH